LSLAEVSVLTPSYNYGRFVEDAILSVARQTRVSLQHVIQDGGSADETHEVLSHHSERLDWRSEPDQGQSDALNKALSRATGRWIAWLNADEFYLPGYLAYLVRVGERTGADVVYGECMFVDEVGRMLRLRSQYRFSYEVLRRYWGCISSCGVLFRRSVLGEDPWDPGIRRVMDWDLFMRLHSRGARFLNVRYPVGAFRVHSDQVTAIPWQAWREEDQLLSARYGLSPGLTEGWKSYKKGRLLHRAHKLVEGSYLRELKARPLRGKDIRWFRSSTAHANMGELARRCYGGLAIDG
jgi:glycosyltransferase involved in cell wall biosynthesis